MKIIVSCDPGSFKHFPDAIDLTIRQQNIGVKTQCRSFSLLITSDGVVLMICNSLGQTPKALDPTFPTMQVNNDACLLNALILIMLTEN